MKILKIYDKLNNHVFQSDAYSGNIIIKEYNNNDNYVQLIINAKIFGINHDKLSYFNYSYYANGLCIETIDLSQKFIIHQKRDKSDRMVYYERINIKNKKSVITINRIYDECGEFVETENYKGNNTTKFKLKNEILTKFLEIIEHGREQEN